MSPSDETLFAAYRDRNDESALRALVERHWAGVFRLARAIVRDAQTAEDAAQEALVRVVQAARARKVLDPFESWLRTVTVNEARMSLRSRKRRERREEEAALRPKEGGALDPAAAVREHAEALEEHLRLPIVLHYGLGLSHREVGLALGCPQGTVSSRIREGLDRLREDLAGAPLQVEALAALGTAPVPPPPGVELLVARAATKAVSFALPGKKLVWALVAFVLCAGAGGAIVARRLLEENGPSRVELGPTQLLPHPTSVGGESPIASDAALGRVESKGVTDLGPRRVLVGPGGGPGDGPRRFISDPSAFGPTPTGPGTVATHRTIKGRVVDGAGAVVAGAHVAVSAPAMARGFGSGMRIQIKGPDPGAAGPDHFKAIDAEVQQTMAVSRALRGLVELASTDSGPDGVFSVDVVTPDTTPRNASLVVAARLDRGDETLLGEKPVAADDVGDVVIQHAPTVTVSLTSGGAPVSGANIDFLDGGGDDTQGATDARGLARHATAAPNTLVTVTMARFATERAMITFAGRDQRLDLVLVPSAIVAGSVRGPDGSALAGVPVVAAVPGAATPLIGTTPPLAQVKTGADGTFSLDGLAPGMSYQLTATPADETVLSGTITVVAPGSANFALGRAGSIVATMATDPPSADPRLKDWPGIEVECNQGSWGPAASDRSVSGARVTFARLAPGTYRVVSHPFIFPEAATDPVTIPPEGGAIVVTLTLTLGRTIVGRVVDGSGAPIPKTRVIRASKGAALGLLVGPDGRFSIPGASPDAVPLTISADGYQDREVTANPGQDDLGDVVLVPAPQK